MLDSITNAAAKTNAMMVPPINQGVRWTMDIGLLLRLPTRIDAGCCCADARKDDGSHCRSAGHARGEQRGACKKDGARFFLE